MVYSWLMVTCALHVVSLRHFVQSINYPDWNHASCTSWTKIYVIIPALCTIMSALRTTRLISQVLANSGLTFRQHTKTFRTFYNFISLTPQRVRSHLPNAMNVIGWDSVHVLASHFVLNRDHSDFFGWPAGGGKIFFSFKNRFILRGFKY